MVVAFVVVVLLIVVEWGYMVSLAWIWLLLLMCPARLVLLEGFVFDEGPISFLGGGIR